MNESRTDGAREDVKARLTDTYGLGCLSTGVGCSRSNWAVRLGVVDGSGSWDELRLRKEGN